MWLASFSVFFYERAQDCANFIDREEENNRLAGKKENLYNLYQ
jgi:hypothetical protein